MANFLDFPSSPFVLPQVQGLKKTIIKLKKDDWIRFPLHKKLKLFAQILQGTCWIFEKTRYCANLSDISFEKKKWNELVPQLQVGQTQTTEEAVVVKSLITLLNDTIIGSNNLSKQSLITSSSYDQHYQHCQNCQLVGWADDLIKFCSTNPPETLPDLQTKFKSIYMQLCCPSEEARNFWNKHCGENFLQIVSEKKTNDFIDAIVPTMRETEEQWDIVVDNQTLMMKFLMVETVPIPLITLHRFGLIVETFGHFSASDTTKFVDYIEQNAVLKKWFHGVQCQTYAKAQLKDARLPLFLIRISPDHIRCLEVDCTKQAYPNEVFHDIVHHSLCNDADSDEWSWDEDKRFARLQALLKEYEMTHCKPKGERIFKLRLAFNSTRSQKYQFAHEHTKEESKKSTN